MNEPHEHVPAPDDRPDVRDRADGTWEQPFDGDVGAERDAWAHADWEPYLDWTRP